MKKMVQGFLTITSMLVVLVSCASQGSGDAAVETAVADSLSAALDKAQEVKKMVEDEGAEIDKLLEGI